MSGWIGDPASGCKTCNPNIPGDAVCDACWEIESRLAAYLARGGERARKTLEGALAASQLQRPQ